VLYWSSFSLFCKRIRRPIRRPPLIKSTDVSSIYRDIRKTNNHQVVCRWGFAPPRRWVLEKHMKHSQWGVWTKIVKGWSTHRCCCLLLRCHCRSSRRSRHSSPLLSSSSVQSHKSRANRTRLSWRWAYIYRSRFGGNHAWNLSDGRGGREHVNF
jgi:hypothetical protein